MITLLISPILSFFSRRLYRSSLQSGTGRGVVYLLYLTALFCVLVVFLCRFLLLPITSSFIEWLALVTPEITLTQSGVSTEAPQPYLVKHPAFGPLYLIDTNKSLAELSSDQSGAIILIGKNHVVVRYPHRNEIRVFDLKHAVEQVRAANQPIHITKKLMWGLTQRFQSMIIPFVLLFLAPLFFIWKLVVVLLYSLIALLLNLLRKERIRYRSLFTLTCYAISPVTLIQAVHFSIPDLYFNLNFYFAFALTVAYLVYGVLVASRNTS